MTGRATARPIGVLFIVASGAGVLSGLIQQPVVDAEDYLTAAARHDTRVATGALFEIVMYVAIAAIAVLLYPVLKRYSERLALGYAVARTIEVVVFVVGSVLISLMLLSVGQDFATAGSPAGSQFQTVGNALVAGRDWANAALAVVAFSVSALILNYVLRRADLVPRWLASWGLVGAVLYLATGVMVIYGLEPFSAPQTLLQLPLAVQEIAFAVWLIVKGFNPTALDAPPRRHAVTPMYHFGDRTADTLALLRRPVRAVIESDGGGVDMGLHLESGFFVGRPVLAAWAIKTPRFRATG